MGDGNNTGGGGGAADSFIGSLISLTSKSEIRYEGVLHSVDVAQSTIALQDVRSFGTEGRKKDGPQIPASDKVYEYIIFRVSDIKDLHVKSSPPARQTQSQQPHHDPAIISLQSQTYPMAPPVTAGNMQASASSATTTANTDGINPGHYSGIPSPNYQANIPPLYHPYGGLGSWGMPPIPPGANGSLGMPMYWPGYYRPPSSISHVQQQAPLPFPSPGSLPNYLAQTRSPAQQPLHAPFSLPTSAWPDQMVSQTLPAKDSAGISSQELATSNVSLSGFSSAFHASSPSVLLVDGKVTASKLALPMASSTIAVPQSSGMVIGASTVSALESTGLLDSVKSLESQKQPVDSEQLSVDDFSTSEPLIATASTSQGQSSANQPLLPLPAHSKQYNQAYSPSNSMFSRKIRGRGRAIGNSASQSQFMEDFDFTAMNEKFKKDEVWGELGKADFREKGEGEDDVSAEAHYEEEDFLKAGPVYVKDHFFDTLSCDAFDRGGQNERTKFSEQRKIDTETFGRFSVRSRGGRGGRGGYRGNFRGGYYGGRLAGNGSRGGRGFARNTAGF